MVWERKPWLVSQSFHYKAEGSKASTDIINTDLSCDCVWNIGPVSFLKVPEQTDKLKIAVQIYVDVNFQKVIYYLLSIGQGSYRGAHVFGIAYKLATIYSVSTYTVCFMQRILERLLQKTCTAQQLSIYIYIYISHNAINLTWPFPFPKQM